jgi:chromate transport protein ChrA
VEARLKLSARFRPVSDFSGNTTCKPSEKGVVMNGMGISVSMDAAQNQAAPVDIPPRVKLWHMARTFLGIGLASFSLAALGEARNWMTKKRRWFTDEEYMQGLGLAQLMPGAPTVNLSSYLGFRLRGLPGAAAATVFFLIPCFLLMLLLSHLYFQYGEMPMVSGLFHGLGALVVGLVFNTILNLWRSGVKTVIQLADGYGWLCHGFLAQNGRYQDPPHHRRCKPRHGSPYSPISRNLPRNRKLEQPQKEPVQIQGSRYR